jgi:hypothetical protein
MDDLDNQTEDVFQGGTTDQWRDYADSLQVSIPDVSLKDATTFVASMTPVIGDAMAAKEVYDELKKDKPNYYLAGALGGAAIVGLIPGIGDAAAKAIKTGAKEVFDVAKRVKPTPKKKIDYGVSKTGVPQINMISDTPAGVYDKTVTQSAVDLMDEPAFGEGFTRRLEKVAQENSIGAGDTTFMPMQVYSELSDRVRSKDFKVVPSKTKKDSPKEQSVWSYPKQLYDSADTSINKNKKPAGYNELKKRGEIKDGDVIVDIGGGRFDNLVEDAAEEGATVKVYDPFNRTPEHNSVVVDSVKDGQADMAMSHNVLNVIQEDKNIIDIALQAENAIKPNGKAHFSVYEGTGKGEGKVTTKGYQRNEKTEAYVPLIEKVFGEANVTRKGKIITATKNVKRFNEGGTIMNEQTRMAFALGGSVDLDTVPDNTQGIDPVSGNEVPIGSTAKEVRDDIPAQLSEGEYVVPADVVRFYGVRFFENLRAKAKFGYQDMAENGRIGGEPVDEPDMDMMFDISELEVEDDGQPMTMNEGGYALSPGDEGYASMGALGLGSEGISAGYEVAGSAPSVEVRTYVNEAGHTIYITFIDGNPQTSIPPGYTLQVEDTADTTTTATTAAQPEPQVVTPSGRDRSSRPMPAPDPINYKELTTDDIAKMLEDQNSAKSTAIAFGAGAINPLLGLFVKGAMMDSARRLDKEIERRIAAEETSTADRAVLEGLLEASKKGKPGLITRVYGALKNEFFPETDDEVKAKEVAMKMDIEAGEVYDFEGDITKNITPTEGAISSGDPAIMGMDQPETKLPTEAEVIAPTTGKVSTYTDPVTREKTKFESYGQVTRDGVYAGDGFEWYEMDVKGSDGAPVLGRRYTGEGEDNNLGQDTIIATELGYGDPADRDVFVKIADISLEEGSEFASKPGSANDGDFLEFLKTGSFGASESFADQEGKDFTPTLTYGEALEKVKEPEVYVPEPIVPESKKAFVSKPIVDETDPNNITTSLLYDNPYGDPITSQQFRDLRDKRKAEEEAAAISAAQAAEAKRAQEAEAAAQRGRDQYKSSMIATNTVAAKAKRRGASASEISKIRSEGRKASQKMSDIARGRPVTGFKEGGLASKKKTKKKKK